MSSCSEACRFSAIVVHALPRDEVLQSENVHEVLEHVDMIGRGGFDCRPAFQSSAKKPSCRRRILGARRSLA